MRKTDEGTEELLALIGRQEAEPAAPDEGGLFTKVGSILGNASCSGERTGLRAVGYTRVSSSMQALFGKSMDDQEDRIEALIEQEGWLAVGILTDSAQSGRTGRRPAFRELQRKVRRRQVDVVVVDRIDRISRNLLTLLSFIRLIEKNSVKLVSLRERIDFSTVWGGLVLYILGALAEFYSEVLSEEMRLRRYHNARSGRLSGAYRLGYCKGLCSECEDPNGEDYCPHYEGRDLGDGEIRVQHPVEREAVRLMFEWYATGEYSYNDIAHRLNEEVFVLPTGDEVRFRTKGVPGRCPPGLFTKDAIRDIIQNPVYVGYVSYSGSDEDGVRRRKPVELFDGKHHGIVSLDLWRRAQLVRRNRYHRSQSLSSGARTYPLSRLVFCAHAHMPMRGISTGGGKYRYYADKLCKQKLSKKDWHQPNVSAPEIEQEVRRLVTRMRIPADWRERILAYLHYDEGMAEVAYERQIVSQRMQRAAELYEEGHYDRERLARVQAECQRQMKALEPVGTSAGQEALALLGSLPVLWETLTDEQRNGLYRILLNGVYVRGKTVAEIEPQPPFLSLLKNAAQRLAASAEEGLSYEVVAEPSEPDLNLSELLERA